MKTLPTLYKKTSVGKKQEWTIGTDGNVIVTRWGQTGGAIQETRDTIAVGKNLGKKNATTPTQQAELEAQAQWEKKLKKGYVQTAGAAMAGEVDEVIEGGISPMLAHRFDEQGHKVTYPAFAQPKLDGHRCIAVVEKGKCTLWSRTRKRITGVPHIEQAVATMVNDADDTYVFDGELYNHDYRDRFEELTSFIRQGTPKPGHEVVQFHIYDYAIQHMKFSERHAHLRTHVGDVHDLDLSYLVFVETIKVADEDELMVAFERFLSQGYEGAMIRNAEGLYVNKRSYDLQKVKEFIDGEFVIVDVEEGRGKLTGHAIFVCQTLGRGKEPGERFRAKLKGETSALKQYWERPELAIGKMLTVKYQGFTKNHIPRFPVALRIREVV